MSNNPTDKRRNLYNGKMLDMSSEDFSELKADARFIMQEIAILRATVYDLKRTVDKSKKEAIDK